VDSVTVEMSGRVSMKISLRKWKCLRWLELAHPSAGGQRGGGGGGGGGGADLGPAWTRGDPHGPDRKCYWARRTFLLESQGGKWIAEREQGGFIMR